MNEQTAEDKHWSEQWAKIFINYPLAPYYAVPYNAVRGVTWRVMDGTGNHIAIVFEEEAARLICQRLNA